MSWLQNAQEKIKKAFSKNEAEGSTEKCEDKVAGLLVVVLRKDTRQPVEKAVVLIKGKTNADKRTDSDGIAFFKPVDPDTYDIEVTLPRDISGDYKVIDLGKQTVGQGACPIKVLHAEPLATLKVHVYKKGDLTKVFGGATIEIVSGAQTHSPKKTENKNGFANFGKTKPGKYTVKATLKGEDKQAFGLNFSTVDVVLKPGQTKVVPMEAFPVNVVTPKIEMEYKVVLLERGLSQHQKAGENKIFADPTYIIASFDQSNPGNSFKSTGKLKCSPAKVDAYLDEACKQKLPGDLAFGATLSNAQLTSGQKIYFRGKTTGKFDVTLALETPANDSIKVEAPKAEKGKENMGVVELKMDLHQHDIVAIKRIEIDPDTDPIATYHTNLKDKALPDQKKMTDQTKVKEGRLLHVQKDGHFGRSKMVCKKLEGQDWPAGTDDYLIVMKTTKKSGDLEVYDQEWQGAIPPGPGIKVSDLKAADKISWVQGKEATNEERDVRLYLGLDRPAGGLAKTIKRNADWARFTVVKIKEVKVDYSPPENRAAAWDGTNNRFYINLAGTWSDRKKKFTTDATTDVNGRKITIGAQLSKELKDVTIHFMFAEDKENRKTANWGVDMPTAPIPAAPLEPPNEWKWKDIARKVKHKDKTHHKSLLHMSAKTDEKGYAKIELLLSRFGGDVFWPACYISEDPHLAKFVDGHADLEKKKPVMAANSVTVWRKFWYKEVKVTDLDVAGFGNSADTYRDVKTEMIAAPVVEMTRAKADKIKPPVIYPKHMVSYYLNNARTAYINNYPGDADDALVVGDDTRKKFLSLAKPDSDQPVMIPILNAHALWVGKDEDGNKIMTGAAAIPWFAVTDFPLDHETDQELLDPPMHGRTLLKSGRWTAQDKKADGTWGRSYSGKLKAGDLELATDRSDPKMVRINRPTKIKLKPGVETRVKIHGLVLRGAESFLGTSYEEGIVNAYTPNDVQDFINTINHEIGHSFNQVTKARPAGIPAHSNQYNKDGSHCKYNNKCCLMYESGPQATAINRYCPVCHPYVLIQDMSKV